jgi:hypothetical protein
LTTQSKNNKKGKTVPYIPKVRRVAVDTITDGLVGRLQSMDGLCRGDINYVITRIVLETLNKNSYHSLSDCVSVLRDAADEIQRRLLGPYEDSAIDKNGDMQCFHSVLRAGRQPLADRWQKEYGRKSQPQGRPYPGGVAPNFITPAEAVADVPITEALTDEQIEIQEAKRRG